MGMEKMRGSIVTPHRATFTVVIKGEIPLDAAPGPMTEGQIQQTVLAGFSTSFLMAGYVTESKIEVKLGAALGLLGDQKGGPNGT